MNTSGVYNKKDATGTIFLKNQREHIFPIKFNKLSALDFFF